MAPIRPKPPQRAATLPPPPKASAPKPPARSSTLPPPASSSTAGKPAAPAAPAAASSAAAPAEPKALKHPALPEGGPSYTAVDMGNGQHGSIAMEGGENQLKDPVGAQVKTLVDKKGNPKTQEKLGGELTTNTGSLEASATHQRNSDGFHYSVQGKAEGPSARYERDSAHVSALGVTSTQLSAEATSFKAQGQAGISASKSERAAKAALTAKVETGAQVTGTLAHDFTPEVGVALTGKAKVSAEAALKGVASFDPTTGSGGAEFEAGAGATASASLTGSAHVGRLHTATEAGVVAGAAAKIAGKARINNGKLETSFEHEVAAGVGTRLKTDVAVDLRKRLKPGLASGLLASTSLAGVGAPQVPERPKSSAEKLIGKILERKSAKPETAQP